jgi:signal peptide peptidase SppA
VSEPARRYPQITKAVYERPWAIQPAMLAVIEEIVRLRAAGTPLTDEQIEARVAAAQNGPRRGAARAQGVAVIPIYGVIAPKANLFSEMSGATTVEGLLREFRSALADPDIGAIVFDVDSPGGSVESITEAANEIRAARGQKPMSAVSNTLMASAAYWLSSAADELIASPSSVTGSIGIIGVHVDVSAQDEMLGEKYTLITAGEGKADGNEHEPLSDDARDDMQAMADDYYALFVADVAAGRGVNKGVVTGDWQAQVFTAKKAKAAGLVDRIDTLDATVRRMVVQANRSGGAAIHALASAGLTAQEQIGVLMSTLPITEQAALWTSERERIVAHFDEKERLRALEGRTLSAHAREQREQLAPINDDLDTDEPEEAISSTPDPRRLAVARAAAALATSHVRSEVTSHAQRS